MNLNALARGRGLSALGPVPGNASGGIEWAARYGYAAKGVVYAVIGVLAVQQALGRGGETSGSREALEQIALGPFGTAALAVVSLGLAGYTLWRLVQAFVDPESGDQDHAGKRWARRGFYLISAGAYGLLTYTGAAVVLGIGSAGGSAGGGGWAADLMSMTWGAWLVGAVGAGIIVRGVVQLVKAYTKSFKDRISSFDLGPGTSKWVIRTSQFALTARGIVFSIIGGTVIHAAATHDAAEAEGGLEGALEVLVAHPWLLGGVGLGFVAYGVYQGVKARYRIIGV